MLVRGQGIVHTALDPGLLGAVALAQAGQLLEGSLGKPGKGPRRETVEKPAQTAVSVA